MAECKKQGKSQSQNKPHLMDMPVELRVGQPRVTVVGNELVFVENHSGLLEYAPTLIKFRAGQGVIAIHGQRLMLDRMGGGAVRIGGVVASVSMQGGGDGVL